MVNVMVIFVVIERCCMLIAIAYHDYVVGVIGVMRSRKRGHMCMCLYAC